MFCYFSKIFFYSTNTLLMWRGRNLQFCKLRDFALLWIRNTCTVSVYIIFKPDFYLIAYFAFDVFYILAYDVFFQEQFILSYGGLRGAVGFSLVTILDQSTVFKDIFLTTTLFIIFVTVFVQGSTIKFVVSKLHIQTKSTEVKKMFQIF